MDKNNYFFRVSALAEADIDYAFARFERISLGLGDMFLLDLDVIFSLLLDNPFLFPQMDDYKRRAVISKFHYSVFYEIENNLVKVVGVLSNSQNPQEWKNR